MSQPVVEDAQATGSQLAAQLRDAVAVNRLDRVMRDGSARSVEKSLAEEVPVALEFDGIGYAVLMATPADLVDLAYGFALSERLIDAPTDILDAEEHKTDDGTIVRVALRARVADRLFARIRHRTTESSCGLCGIENLEQVMRPLPRVPQWTGSAAPVFAAADALGQRQVLNSVTRAVHAAARCTIAGEILDVREDVGRHNAFDKLIGAMLRTGAGWNDGFALLSSRCSYELVEKAALSGCPMLATVSAATTLAVRRAAESGLTLHTVVRPDALLRVL
jgi:FdhD protein